MEKSEIFSKQTTTNSNRIATSCVCCASNNLTASPAILMPFVSHRALGLAPVKIDASWELRTIPSGMAYVLCNSLLCENCQLLFLDIRFSNQEMLRLYSDYRGESYTSLRDFYEPGYFFRNKELEKTIPYLADTEEFISLFVEKPNSILDWGGDTGNNTPFKNIASSIQIYDISGKLDSSEVSRTNSKKFLDSFDLITCCHVLEHVPYPALELSEIKKFMNSNTRLFVEVPLETLRVYNDASEILARKRHWHEHINFYSENALKQLMKLSDLNILGFRTMKTHFEEKDGFVFQLVCSL